jgi:xanthine dehydrogenase YagS FAD-binding subunit
MKLFDYQRAKSVDDAVVQGGVYLAGGTSLIDLLKIGVLEAPKLVDLNRLDLKKIAPERDGIRIGALVSNSELANNAEVRNRYPALSQALLSGASPQLRNAATVGGNLLQRTRCAYYRDLTTRCNKRTPGSGCDALEGWTRMHALLGTSGKCIAAHPSDMCVALAALEAVIRVRGPGGERELAIADLHLLPGETPEREFSLGQAEVIESVFVPFSELARRSRYVKARDRQSFAFALASCAASVEVAASRIAAARIALGGVGTKPWRCGEAEQAIVGSPPTKETFLKAAEVALRGAVPRNGNDFKITLAKRCIVRALTTSAEAA